MSEKDFADRLREHFPRQVADRLVELCDREREGTLTDGDQDTVDSLWEILTEPVDEGPEPSGEWDDLEEGGVTILPIEGGKWLVNQPGLPEVATWTTEQLITQIKVTSKAVTRSLRAGRPPEGSED